MEERINQLDIAELRDVYIGDSETAETRYKAVYNVSQGKVSCIAGKDYEIIQHRDVANAFIGACNNLNIQTKAIIRNQQDRVYIDVEFPEVKIGAGLNEEFIAGFRLINSYDKSTGIIIIPRLVRLACMNGMVLNVKGFVKSFSYRHNQEQASQFRSYVEIALKETINSSPRLQSMVENCIGDSIEWQMLDNIMNKLVTAKKHRKAILRLMEGKELTRWNLYNAFTSYATHNRQLKPTMEMAIQEKAMRVISNPFEKLLRLKE